MMRFVICTIFWIFSHSVFCAPTLTAATAVPLNQTLQNSQFSFDIKEANKKFDKLNIQLSTQNLDLKTLSAAVKLLNKLIASANDCIDNNEKRLNTLDEQIQQAVAANGATTAVATASTGTVTNDTNKSDADLVYLNTERKKLASQLSQCRLFSIRAKEAVDAYSVTITKLKHAETFTRGLTLWSIVKTSQELPAETPLVSINLTLPQPFTSLIFLSSLSVISTCIAGLFLVYARRHRWIKHHLRIRTFQVSNFVILSMFLWCTLFAIQLKLYALHHTLETTMSLHLMTALSIYALGLLVIAFLFNVKRIRAFFYWYSLDSLFFKALTMFLFSFYALAFLAKFVAKHITLQPVLWQLGTSLFLLAVLTTAIFFVYYFCHAHRHIPFIKHHHRFVKRLSAVLFLACGTLDVFGYHMLAMHLTFAYISTFAVTFCAWLLDQAMNKFYIACTHLGVWHNKINQFFGYKPSQTPTELFILKITLQICIFALAIYLIFHSWGYANNYVESVYRQIFFGFHFGTFTFYPARIVAGTIVFCTLYLLCRALSRTFSRHEQFEDEEEAQVAIASILSYLGFALSMIAGFLVAGFNFTGLAIIAGALSVGIGLGLQSIVNNFVSGIILLLEKPIKPGDKIRVDNVEGVVKKIRVRSTQITTSAREDIIIPNSDLITRPVTNFMYSDKYLSIHCAVNVAYGTDTHLVRDLLLQAVQKHDEIIKTTRNKPTVLFHSFGENGLVFQIWFLIKDGNHKSDIKSFIHFEIERLFREHQIQFAFPQRDIHIKMSEFKSFSDDK